jgi:hypothetical protein
MPYPGNSLCYSSLEAGCDAPNSRLAVLLLPVGLFLNYDLDAGCAASSCRFDVLLLSGGWLRSKVGAKSLFR